MSEEELTEQIASAFSKLQPKQYDLTTEIQVDKALFRVGNTGLSFNLKEGNGVLYLSQDFTPDYDMYPPENTKERIKRALLYAGGLYTFITDYYLLKNGEYNLPSIVRGSTNEKMSAFRQKLLGEHYRVDESINDAGEYIYKYKFNLNNISKDKMLMDKLNKMNSKLLRQKYKTKMRPTFFRIKPIMPDNNSEKPIWLK